MSLRRITFAVLSSFLLVTCSSCSLAGFDQNGDGTVTRSEIAQSFYAVTATRQREGNRECTSFRWRNGEAIRVDCRTVFATP